jgi:zinc protease
VKRSLLLILLVSSLLIGSDFSGVALAQRSRPRTKQPTSSTATAPAPAPLAEAAPLVNKVLSNGLEVIVLEDHSVPLVTVELAVRNGSFTEPPDLNGLSHLFEHMFFKVTPDAALKNEYLRNIDALGIIYNGETHEEVVNYYFTISMRFLRDQAQFQTFDEGQFAQEREVVIGN